MILLQFEHVINKIKQRCEANGDDELKRKIGGNFENLPAYDAKYHLKCYNKYMAKETEKGEKEPSVHDSAFELLVDYIDPLLEEGRALEMTSLLSILKLLLKEKEYEQYDSYTSQKLKHLDKALWFEHYFH